MGILLIRKPFVILYELPDEVYIHHPHGYFEKDPFQIRQPIWFFINCCLASKLSAKKLINSDQSSVDGT